MLYEKIVFKSTLQMVERWVLNGMLSFQWYVEEIWISRNNQMVGQADQTRGLSWSNPIIVCSEKWERDRWSKHRFNKSWQPTVLVFEVIGHIYHLLLLLSLKSSSDKKKGGGKKTGKQLDFINRSSSRVNKFTNLFIKLSFYLCTILS